MTTMSLLGLMLTNLCLLELGDGLPGIPVPIPEEYKSCRLQGDNYCYMCMLQWKRMISMFKITDFYYQLSMDNMRSTSFASFQVL